MLLKRQTLNLCYCLEKNSSGTLVQSREVELKAFIDQVKNAERFQPHRVFLRANTLLFINSVLGN